LLSRLGDTRIFDKNALEMVAKKVSHYSGDIRRSLQISKRAVEICRDEVYGREGPPQNSRTAPQTVNYNHI